MKHQASGSFRSVLSNRAPPRIAVIGAGIAGLSCARELGLRGFEPVVFEASDRLGGRCSSRATPLGWFDDAAQSIHGATRLASFAVQLPGELAAMHPWAVPATPEEDEQGRDWDGNEDEADAKRSLNLVGAVGVPSMLALAQAIARPLQVRLHTPILHATRRGARWVLRDAAGHIDEGFQALVLAIPAPLALPLAQDSPRLAAALRAVRYRSRWVLLLGCERPVGLPGYREFQGSPIERVAAMHSKPGRPATVPQRWFVEADPRWSLQHQHADAETVADLLLDNFRAHAGRPITPHYLRAYQWQHAFVETPAAADSHPHPHPHSNSNSNSQCLWDEDAQLGVCGDSAVASQVDLVHRSGVALAQTMAEALYRRGDRRAVQAPDRVPREVFEAQAVHG